MSVNFPWAEKYLVHPFYGTYLKKKYKLEFIGKEKIEALTEDAVIFANHVHTLDPFFISAVYPYHIRWVAGSYLFKMKGVSYLLQKWVRAIPKTQGRSDLTTIRAIADALKNKDCVGVFPEGTRTWDGDMMDIHTATAKLVRIFKSPAVFINIEGAFENKPRWAETERKGKVTIRVVDVLLPDEIKSMKNDEILQRTVKALSYSHEDWKKKYPGVEYNSPKQAEGIERLFYLCPHCKKFGTFVSSGRKIECSYCHAKAAIDGRYNIVDRQNIPYETMTEWHQAERKELRELLHSEPANKVLFEDHGVLLQMGGKKKQHVLSKEFKVSSTKENLIFSFSDREEMTFAYEKIESMIICAKYTVEFFYESQQYRFRLQGRESSLKYQDLYFEIVKNKGETT